jgi:uncharacterized membrane protein YcaP (DUF421 family)
MDYIKVILTTLLSITALFFSTKIIGNKQMSELNMFDYINGITIGSIGAELATALETNFLFPLIALVLYTFFIWLSSYISSKNLAARRFLTGRSILLMENGKIYNKNFKTSKIDMNEFLSQCRISGYFNLDDIDTAVLEQNGKISFLPKSAARPVNPKDLSLQPEQEKLVITVILDGCVLEENLKRSGNNTVWLENELRRLKIGNIKDIFIATCDNNNKLSAYVKVKENPKNDLFE